MRFKLFPLVALFIVWTGAVGQVPANSVDWQESDVPPPPTVSDKGLIPIDMPANLTLRFGVDPSTLAITKDGVVRYVMVASSGTGVRNVLYEGVRCATGEVKTYARQNSSGQWVPVTQAQWRPLQGSATAAHAMALARQGACSGRSVSTDSVAVLVNKLKNWKPDPH